jgi:hypothetical protein
MKALVVVFAVALGLAACGDDDPAAAPDSIATAATSTVPETTGAPATTQLPATSAPVNTTEPPPDTTEAPTTAPRETAPATTEAPVPTGPTAATAVVYTTTGDARFPLLPVGWWDGAAWGSVVWPAPDVPLPTATIGTFSVASVELTDGPLSGLTDFRSEVYECVESPGLPSVVLDTQLPESTEWYGYRALAVTADWNVQPRPVRAVGLDAPEYQLLGESVVTADAETDPTLGDVTQVIRADLDGDGVEEVFVVFEHIADENALATPGDFSTLIARYPSADGTVVDEVLFEHVVRSPVDYPSLDRARIGAIADVNGDGVMEVAVGVTYWEGASLEVREFRDGALHPVMSSGCGV